MRAFLFLLKIILLYAATLCCTSAMGQSSIELAQKNVYRQKWQRAYELLTKALAKDSLNVTAKYVLAQYFFSKANPAYSLDSAYQHVLGAKRDFNNASPKQRERLKRFPLDSILLDNLHYQIDSLAFSRVKAIDTEKAWIDFLDYFDSSSFRKPAEFMRDSAAFRDAQRENTYEGFQLFFQKYPTAKQSARAKQSYEKLLLAAKTADQTLASYEAFLAEYPETSYRRQVEEVIFEYETASGQYNTYVDFIRSHPHNPFLQRAKDILYHIVLPHERAEKWPADFNSDSLIIVTALEEDYLVPFLKNKMFGFMTSSSQEVIPAQFDSLSSAYQCGNINEDVLALPGKLIGKNGALIWKGNVTHFEDIGSGFLLIEELGCKSLIHKTGFKIGQACIDDANILDGRFAAILARERWSIFSLAGRLLISDLEEIISLHDVFGLKKNDKIKLMPVEVLGKLPIPPEFGGMPEFDFVSAWDNGLILVKNGKKVGLLDHALRSICAVTEQTVIPAGSAFITTDSTGSRVHNKAGQSSPLFQQIVPLKPWIIGKDSSWRFLDADKINYATTGYDTIIAHGPVAAAYTMDSTFVHSAERQIWKGPKPSAIALIQSDSLYFLVIEKGNQKSIYNRFGKKLFTTNFDRVQYARNDCFIVHKNEKKGMLTSKGTLVLPSVHDAIVAVDNRTVSLLKSSQFGLFDCIRYKHIRPHYAKNLSVYNERIVTAYKDGLFGFIGWDDKPLSKFEFTEIKFWNDTVALVRKNSDWMLYEIKTRKFLVDNIKNVKLIRDAPNDKLAIIHQGTSHGVIHSLKGTIIPVSFTDIINVGSSEKPLYFTEKNVPEALLSVVIYYDHEGKPLRKEIYDHEDYDKIYCNSP